MLVSFDISTHSVFMNKMREIDLPALRLFKCEQKFLYASKQLVKGDVKLEDAHNLLPVPTLNLRRSLELSHEQVDTTATELLKLLVVKGNLNSENEDGAPSTK